MKFHPTEIAGYEGRLEELAKKVFSMRYDRVAEFMFFGMTELKRQMDNDKERGRDKLSQMLLIAVYKTGELTAELMKVFVFCKKFMKHELDKNQQ
jgi:hypothetical protein